MEKLTKQQLENTIKAIQDFKHLIKEKGTKEETVKYLIRETQLTKEECEIAFDFYNGIQLSDEKCKAAFDYCECTCTDECVSGYNPNCTCAHPECHCTEARSNN